MQPDSTPSTGSAPPNSGRVAFRSGLIIGIILAIVEAIILVVSTFYSIGALQSIRIAPNLGVSIISVVLVVVGFFLGLIAYFVSGIFGSRVTGKVSTGVFAGMWTGAIYGVIDCIVYMILLIMVKLGPTLNYYTRIYHYSAAQINQLRLVTITAGVIGSIIGIGFAVGLGAGLGALGGLIGRRSSKAPRPQQPYPVQFYPGQPYPAMPQYPGPFYPGQPYPGQPYAAMPQYPAQGYPEQWPYAQPQPLQRDSVEQARPEQSGLQPERASARNGGDVRDAQLDRSYHPPLQAGSPGQPGIQQSEPENPYSN